MSHNLILEKDGVYDIYDVYQTPNAVTWAALDSPDPTRVYKDWVIRERKGQFPEETQQHFKRIDELIADGYSWSYT